MGLWELTRPGARKARQGYAEVRKLSTPRGKTDTKQVKTRHFLWGRSKSTPLFLSLTSPRSSFSLWFPPLTICTSLLRQSPAGRLHTLPICVSLHGTMKRHVVHSPAPDTHARGHATKMRSARYAAAVLPESRPTTPPAFRSAPPRNARRLTFRRLFLWRPGTKKRAPGGQKEKERPGLGVWRG